MFIRNFLKAMLMVPFLLSAAQAQDDTALVQVLTAHVKPGMEARFEEVLSAYRQASREQGAENYWLSAQAISGEPAYRFHIAMSSWGDLANPQPQLSETFGEREVARLMALLSDSVTSMHTAFFREPANMSNPPPDTGEPPAALIYIDFTMNNPDAAQQWGQMTIKTAEAFRAVLPDFHFVAAMPDFGATGPRTILILPSMSDLDTPGAPPGEIVVQHFGEEEGARINAMAESIESSTASLWRPRPDLNYQPGE